MKTRKLFNTSEYKTSRILETVLGGTGFRVYPELMMNRVLDLGSETLSRQERNTLNNSSFDFVVYNEISHPEFAVEFDGPHHYVDEKQQQSDIRKNRICAKARLPLLRIGDEFLTEYDKVCLLEYVIRRFVDWRNDTARISEEESDIASYLAKEGANEEEYERMRDPQIMWDLLHPFPASLEIAERLFCAHDVVSSWIDPDTYCKAFSQPQLLLFEQYGMGSHPIGLDYYREERSYELRQMTRSAPEQFEPRRIHFLSVAVTCQFKLPTADRRRFYSGDSRLLIEDAHGQELPGISMSQLANHFCDFLALNKLRTWVEQNLKSTGLHRE